MLFIQIDKTNETTNKTTSLNQVLYSTEQEQTTNDRRELINKKKKARLKYQHTEERNKSAKEKTVCRHRAPPPQKRVELQRLENKKCDCTNNVAESNSVFFVKITYCQT